MDACWVITVNGILWKLDLRDVVNRWLLYGKYEGSTISDWFASWLSGGGIVVDSGANIGQSLIFVAPLPDVKVYAFEPLSEATEWLRECLFYHPDWQVVVEQVGLSDHADQLQLRENGPRSTFREDWYVGNELPRERINVERLDDYLLGRGIEKIRLWMLNVEGMEYKALRGAEHYLETKKIDAIYLRVTSDNYANCQSLLVNHGYQLFCLDGRELLPVLGKIKPAVNLLVLPVC